VARQLSYGRLASRERCLYDLARSLVNTSPPISAPAVAGADVPAAAVIWSETLAASRDEFISSSQKISGDAAHAEKPRTTSAFCNERLFATYP
jgi:hypothetical protein